MERIEEAVQHQASSAFRRSDHDFGADAARAFHEHQIAGFHQRGREIGGLRAAGGVVHAFDAAMPASTAPVRDARAPALRPPQSSTRDAGIGRFLSRLRGAAPRWSRPARASRRSRRRGAR